MNLEHAIDLQIGPRDIYGSRPRRIDANPSRYSSYNDDAWMMDPILFGHHNHSTMLNFRTISQARRETAKRLMYALLVAEPPDGEQLPSTATISAQLSNVRFFFRWLDETERGSLSELTREDLDAYRLHLQQSIGATKRDKLNSRLRAVRLFYQYREHLADAVSFDPKILEGWNGRLTRRARRIENTTPRIPEEVTIPLLGWATRFVEDFAADILAARRECIWLAQRGRKVPAAQRVNRTTEQRAEAIQGVLNRYIEAHRPLPAATCPPFNDNLAVNLNHLIREASATIESARAKQLIRAAVEAVGIDDDTYIWHENTSEVLRQIAGPHFRYEDVPRWSLLLATACYILVAFYSGMRDSEIKSLARGCVQIDRDATGALEVIRVRGLAFKGELSPAGVPATWVVGPVVKVAVEVLETIRDHDGDEALFAPLRVGGQAPRSLGRLAISGLTTIKHLEHFVKWVNHYSTAAGRNDSIPNVDGAPWPLNSRQFRRTLAWYIARRPGGSLAGAIQYRHRSVQMFEGYAGTSQSGFRAEVESEEAIYRGEYLLELAAGDFEATGPAAAIAQTRAESFANQANFAGIVVDNEHQLERLVKTKGPAVYPGEYVMCVFDQDKALCILGLADKPDQSACQPLRCKNAALDDTNRRYWEAEKLSASSALENELSPFVQTRLQNRAQQIDRLLSEGNQS